MLVFRFGSLQAGFMGWITGIIVGFLAFGLNWQVLWISQVKSLLLTMNVLLVLWPALFLYHLVDQVGGIRAIAIALQSVIPDKGWLLIIQAWILTGLVENLTGFGMPIAIVAPMMIALGVAPLTAVTVSAIGYSWAVSVGGMALPFRTLVDVTNINPITLFPTTALLLSITALLSGLSVAFILKQGVHWWRVLILSIIVGGVQYLTGFFGMIPISSFSAAIIGIIGGYFLCKKHDGFHITSNISWELKSGVLTYGFLIATIILVTTIKPINRFLTNITWTNQFPESISNNGFVIPAGNGYLYHPLVHSGTLILLSAVFAIIVLPRIKSLPIGKVKPALILVRRAAIPASLGTLFMMALSTLMEHLGMTLLISQSLSRLVGSVYPVFSPLVGMIGAFATGSNTNSNVLFGAMQKGVAELLNISPVILLAAQTVGGSLGSMIAPAKLAVGSSTNELKGREGEVLRITLPICLGITLVIGLITLMLVYLHN
jgi:lactate permease